MKENTKHYRWNEMHLRSLLKACSWRFWATLTTMIISYFITGNVKYAIAIGSIEVVTKIFLYYLHERLWSRVKLGIKIKGNTTLTSEMPLNADFRQNQ